MTSSSSKSRSNAPILPITFTFPISSSNSSQPSDLIPSQPSLASLPSTFTFHRSSSPTRVTTTTTSSAVNAFRISINNRSLSPTARTSTVAKKTCMCSPTTHPGSFRCALHRNNNRNSDSNSSGSSRCIPMRLNLRRSAMTNSLVRIGTVEGDWVRRALTALIRPSSHQQRRRGEFRPRLSRLSIMSKAQDDDDDDDDVN